MQKPMIMALGGVLAGGVVAAVLFVFVLGGSSAAEPPPAEVGEPEPVSVPGKLGPHITVGERVFTLLSPAESQRYVKLEIVIEFETFDAAWEHVLHGCVFAGGEGGASPCQSELEALLHEFEEHEIGTGRTLIEDAITTIVSSHSLEEVGTVTGREAMRQEIRDAVDDIIYEPRVTRVLFTQFITQ